MPSIYEETVETAEQLAKIVNAHLAHSIEEQCMRKNPNSFGYIVIASEVESPSLFSSNSLDKDALLSNLKSLCKALSSSSAFISRASSAMTGECPLRPRERSSPYDRCNNLLYTTVQKSPAS